MKLSSLLAPLIAAKAPHELIMETILAFEAEEARRLEEVEEADEDRRAKGRARWRKYQQNKRNANVSQHEQTLAANSREGVTRVEGLTSNSEIEPQEENKKRATGALSAEFDTTFWPAFPNKTGKPKALSAFLAARRKAELTAIMAGLRRYIASKPPDRPWLNPATFLNQERWTDEPAFTARAGPTTRSNPLADAFASMRPPDERHPPPTDDTVLYLPAAAR